MLSEIFGNFEVTLLFSDFKCIFKCYAFRKTKLYCNSKI